LFVAIVAFVSGRCHVLGGARLSLEPALVIALVRRRVLHAAGDLRPKQKGDGGG
jgi:hypothetical protein